MTTNHRRAFLRSGSSSSRLAQPAWTYWVISQIMANGLARIFVVMPASPPESALKRLKKGLFDALSEYPHWLYFAYMYAQRLTRGGGSGFPDCHGPRIAPAPHLDPLALTDIRPLIKGVPVMAFSDEDNLGPTTAPAKTPGRQMPSPDLLICLNARVDKLPVRAGLTPPPLGLWFFDHEETMSRPLVPGFWEVVEGVPVTILRIKRRFEGPEQEETIHEAWLPTHLPDDPYSVYGTVSRFFWTAAAAVLRKLEELRIGALERGGVDCGTRFPACDGPHAARDTSPDGPDSNEPAQAPSNARMIRVAAKRALHRARGWVEERTSYEQWFVAYKFPDRLDLAPGLVGFVKMLPPKDRFWADPFALRVNGEYYIFLEEYLHRAKKGHISVVKLGPQGEAWSDPVKIIERDYHLSYPFVFSWNSDFYMVPESGANGTVEMYKCLSFPYEWQFEQVLIPDIRGADPTLTEIDGTWWMFVATKPYDVVADDNYMELSLFFADTPLGPWKPHRRNPVKSDTRSSRPAGSLFRRNGNLYRPAQDCSRKYGYAVSINRIVTLTRTDFAEVEVAKILPEWSTELTCCHTFNECDDLTVVDGMRVLKRFH